MKVNPAAAFELNMEVIEMPPDGSLCYECKEVITGKMFQYFLFEGVDPTATKFKLCQACYGQGTDKNS